MQDLNKNVQELKKLVLEFDYMKALDQFYHPDVQIFENDLPAGKGLADYRLQALAYIENVSNYHAELIDVIVGENISAFCWKYSFDHKKWGYWNKQQVSVQQWKDGKIVIERHIYSQ